MYTGVSVTAALTGVLFYFLFRHYDEQEAEMNELDAYAEKPANEKQVD